jgi:alanine-alpha-ketoisovalerate/valine-pyruvate aminotransferase
MFIYNTSQIKVNALVIPKQQTIFSPALAKLKLPGLKCGVFLDEDTVHIVFSGLKVVFMLC